MYYVSFPLMVKNEELCIPRMALTKGFHEAQQSGPKRIDEPCRTVKENVSIEAKPCLLSGKDSSCLDKVN